MSKEQREAADAALRIVSRTGLGGTIAERRVNFEAGASPQDTAGLVAVETTLGGRPALEIADAARDAGTLLYFHGGGFVIGSHRTGAKLAAALVRRTGLRAYSLDYRLAPEDPFPAWVLDGLAAYRELLERTGPERIVVAGDSAGGTLTVQTLMAARDAGLPMPAAAVAFSPAADPSASGSTMTTKHGIDPLFTRADIEWFRAQNLGDADPLAPLANPARTGELRGLPPTLIQVGSHEVLLDDSVMLAGRLGEFDVDVTLEIVAGVPHVFPSFTGVLDEADAALDRVATFVTARLGAAVPA
jgi:acetyl esterase/lipase